jgi:drug/metabolite transporter (DMT)-like permease
MPAAARAALLTACFLWAVSFIATKVALVSAPPLVLVTLRLLISAACFLVWMAVAGRRQLLQIRSRLKPLIGLSLVGASLHYSSQTIGLQYTTAANASLYAITAPITIAVLAVLFLGERVSITKVIGIITAVAGVLVVMGLEALLAFDLTGHLLGDLLVMASIVLWGLFTVLGKRMTDEIGALAVTAGVTVIGALWMIPAGYVEMHLTSFLLATITTSGWLAIAFLGVLCSFLATLLYFIALQQSESQKVGVYLYTLPPMTAVISAFYLGETLTWSFVIGAALVFFGLYITERAQAVQAR